MQALIKKNNCFLQILLCCASLVIVSLPTTSYAGTTASDNYTLLAPLPCIPTPAQTGSGGQSIPAETCSGTNSQIITQVSFQSYIQYAVNLLIALSAVAAVFMIVWGGFEYMTSSIVSMKSDGKTKMTNAIYGLLLVLGSYLILRTIDPRLVQIPGTLVPQLQLKSTLTQNASASFFDQLAQQAQQYNIQTSEYGNAKNQAQTTVNSLQQKLSGLQSQLGSLSNLPDNDPQVQSVKAQIQDTQNQISNAEAGLTLSTWQAAMSAQMNSGNVGSGADTAQYKTLADVQSAEKNVQTAYDNGLQDLYTSGGDTDPNIAALNKTYYQTYGNLVLQEAQVVLATPSSSILDYQTAIKDMNLITSSFPSDLRNQAATLQTQLTNKYLGIQ